MMKRLADWDGIYPEYIVMDRGPLAKATGVQIESHYDPTRAGRVYINEHTFDTLYSEPRCPHMRLHPETVPRELAVIEQNIVFAVEAGDTERERALLKLYSDIEKAAEDAGPDGVVHLRNQTDLAIPLSDEVEILELHPIKSGKHRT